MPSITGSILRRLASENPYKTGNICARKNLADSFTAEKAKANIELLIGNDFFDFIIPQKVEVQPRLYMLASKLEWLLTGSTTENAEDTPEYNMLFMTYSINTVKETGLLLPDRSFPMEPDLEHFFRLESIGITDSHLDSDKDRALKIFEKILQI